MSAAAAQHSTTPTSLSALARVFLKLGTTAFGGPAAHIAMMEDEVVTRRGWLTRADFLDLVGATNLIPGPNSTEMAIHIGRTRAGWPGLVVAGASFIVPAALIVCGLAWIYVRAGSLPQVSGVLYGIKPVVVAVVLQAVWRLASTAIRTPVLAIVCVLSAVAAFLGVNEIAILVAAGLVVVASGFSRTSGSIETSVSQFFSWSLTSVRAPTSMTVLVGGTTAGAVVAVGLWPLFAFFLKVGSVLFGSGYVLLAFLRSGLVEGHRWLTEGQLLDAVAIGQVTPGPVFTTATFIGYLLAGVPGAAVATLGIFLPAFVFVAMSGPLIPRLRRSPTASAVLDGVNAASLALMMVVTIQLGRTALVDPIAIALAVLSAVLLFRFRANSALLVCGGAFVGFCAQTSGLR